MTSQWDREVQHLVDTFPISKEVAEAALEEHVELDDAIEALQSGWMPVVMMRVLYNFDAGASGSQVSVVAGQLVQLVKEGPQWTKVCVETRGVKTSGYVPASYVKAVSSGDDGDGGIDKEEGKPADASVASTTTPKDASASVPQITVSSSRPSGRGKKPRPVDRAGSLRASLHAVVPKRKLVRRKSVGGAPLESALSSGAANVDPKKRAARQKHRKFRRRPSGDDPRLGRRGSDDSSSSMLSGDEAVEGTPKHRRRHRRAPSKTQRVRCTLCDAVILLAEAGEHEAMCKGNASDSSQQSQRVRSTSSASDCDASSSAASPPASPRGGDRKPCNDRAATSPLSLQLNLAQTPDAKLREIERLQQTGRRQEALDMIEVVLKEIEASSMGRNSQQYAEVLNVKADIYNRQGEFEKALELFEDVLSIQRNIDPLGTPSFMVTPRLDPEDDSDTSPSPILSRELKGSKSGQSRDPNNDSISFKNKLFKKAKKSLFRGSKKVLKVEEAFSPCKVKAVEAFDGQAVGPHCLSCDIGQHVVLQRWASDQDSYWLQCESKGKEGVLPITICGSNIPFAVAISKGIRDAKSLSTILLRTARRGDMTFVKALCTVSMQEEDSSKCAMQIITALMNEDCLWSVFEALIDEEVRLCDRPTELFRTDSPATWLLASWLRLEAYDVAQQVLTLCLPLVMNEPAAFEVMYVQNKEQLFTRMLNVLVVCDWIIAAVKSVSESFSASVKLFCHHVTVKVSKKFPDHGADIIGGFIFLRFLTPALISPERYGLSEPVSLPARKSLVLVCKVLQKAANGASPFSRSPLSCATSWLLSRQKVVAEMVCAMATRDTRVVDPEAPKMVFGDVPLTEALAHTAYPFYERVTKRLPDLEARCTPSVASHYFTNLRRFLGPLAPHPDTVTALKDALRSLEWTNGMPVRAPLRLRFRGARKHLRSLRSEASADVVDALRKAVFSVSDEGGTGGGGGGAAAANSTG